MMQVLLLDAFKKYRSSLRQSGGPKLVDRRTMKGLGGGSVGHAQTTLEPQTHS